MSDEVEFTRHNRQVIQRMADDDVLTSLSTQWFERASTHEYSYHFSWLGRPIIQFPQDIVALQEIIWDVEPDLIIETGIARGGSIVFLASMLQLLGGDGLVVGIDIDIREHNREALESHRLYPRMRLIEGSSVAPEVLREVEHLVDNASKVMVILDSNHTHEHVADELVAYSPFVTRDSYLVVMDTVVETMPEEFSANRPWGPGDNPMTALRAFLETTDRFVLEPEIQNKLQLTVAPNGYLRCVRD